MPKKTFSDVIPPEKKKKSIRNIPIPERKQNKIDILLEETAVYRKEHATYSPEQEEATEEPKTVRTRRVTKKKSIISPLWFGVGTLVVFAGLFFWLFRESATITIALKTEAIPVNITGTTTEASYQVVASKKEESTELPTTGTPEKVEKKAAGTIIVYNTSTASQQLIATTRVQTPEGLIYRLDKAVTVPAAKGTTPGSIEAAVTADVAGPTYNIAKSDFVIPGFKGTAKYDQFYARSKTSMTGGFSGMVGQISDADLKTATDKLKATLMTAVEGDIASQVPEDSIFFKDGGLITSFAYSVVPSGDGKAMVKGEMTGEALVFKKQDINSMLATVLGEEHRFDNLYSLVLTINGGQAPSSFISKPNMTINYAGTLTTGQSFDAEALKATLAGKSKKQLTEILKMYPEIVKADAVVRPIWKGTFPAKTKNIQVIVTK